MPLLTKESRYVALTTAKPWINENMIIRSAERIVGCRRIGDGKEPCSVCVEMSDKWTMGIESFADGIAEGGLELCGN